MQLNVHEVISSADKLTLTLSMCVEKLRHRHYSRSTIQHEIEP